MADGLTLTTGRREKKAMIYADAELMREQSVWNIDYGILQ